MGLLAHLALSLRETYKKKEQKTEFEEALHLMNETATEMAMENRSKICVMKAR